jgi:transposase
MCNRCKVVKPVLTLGDRLFMCNACGHVDDRDLNAAKNINQLAGYARSDACREAERWPEL